MRSLILALCICCSCGARAQLVDTIRHRLEQPRKLVVKLDSHGSFISNESVAFLGVKLGFEHAGRVQYGIGYSFLFSPVEHTELVMGEGAVNAQLHFGYVTPYFDYAFYQRGPWELRIPVQLGIGGGSVVYDGADGNTHTIKRSFVLLYEPCMTVQYRFLKYFAVCGGWGYRLVFGNTHLADGLTAPIYTFGIHVFFGDLWRDVNGP